MSKSISKTNPQKKHVKSACACGVNCQCKNCRCGPTAAFFDTLGNTTRLLIVETLREKPYNVSELIEKTGIEQTLASHNLKQLERNGFVTSKQQGKSRIYQINTKSVEPLLNLVHEHVQKYCIQNAKPCSCGSKKTRGTK
jgi:DNA-binding transcriptional ArsR family regulator